MIMVVAFLPGLKHADYIRMLESNDPGGNPSK
jgi:hypothetical protein